MMASVQEKKTSVYAWPAPADRQVIGQRIERIDGVYKTTGAAKYSYDMNFDGLLHAKLLTSPHAHATVTKLDLEAAQKVNGVRAIYLFPEGKEGAELMYHHQPIAAVAADTPEQAEDGVAAIKIEYKVLPHWVDEQDLEGAREAKMTVEGEEQVEGDPDTGFKEAAAVVEAQYGVPSITHCCWETHGSTCVFEGRKLTAYLSTQNVSGTAGQFTNGLNMKNVDIESAEVICHYEGGGFGSKFGADSWGIAAAYMAHQTKRPVKLMLSRATEQCIGGNRPSAFANVRVGARKDGTVVAWQSHHWTNGGVGNSLVGVQVMPYVIRVGNTRKQQTTIRTHRGGSAAWRAPNHPQGCAVSHAALDDLAAALGMDSLAFFRKNLNLFGRVDLYAKEMDLGAELIGWKEKWHPRGKGSKGPVKQGLGLALHTWGGGAHPSTCRLKIHPDGGVETFLGSQDIGTGTKTVIAAVIGETLGLPVKAVKVNIGRSSYPTSGPSGGSTTVGGVSGSNRKAAVEARNQLFAKVAPKLKAQPDQLEAKGGRISVKGDSNRSLAWKDATALLGVMPLEVEGKHAGDEPGLTASVVGGVQMADVSVDTDTGIVRINKYVAVQDIGTVIDLLTAESQIYGAVIMGIAYALSEEQIMDNATGRFINSDIVNYKLPRIGDIGQIVVRVIGPDDGEVGMQQYNRGVIGLGEPPVISPGGAISNAVANAIGVRVPSLPLTPDRVLAALEKGGKA